MSDTCGSSLISCLYVPCTSTLHAGACQGLREHSPLDPLLQELQSLSRCLAAQQDRASWLGGLTYHEDAFEPLYHMLLAAHAAATCVRRDSALRSAAVPLLQSSARALLSCGMHPLIGHLLYVVRLQAHLSVALHASEGIMQTACVSCAQAVPRSTTLSCTIAGASCSVILMTLNFCTLCTASHHCRTIAALCDIPFVG